VSSRLARTGSGGGSASAMSAGVLHARVAATAPATSSHLALARQSPHQSPPWDNDPTTSRAELHVRHGGWSIEFGFSNSLADDDVSTCTLAEFSSRWRPHRGPFVRSAQPRPSRTRWQYGSCTRSRWCACVSYRLTADLRGRKPPSPAAPTRWPRSSRRRRVSHRTHCRALRSPPGSAPATLPGSPLSMRLR
jgi:hypothetical protein